MLKSSPAYEVGRYMIKSSKKPFGLYMIWSRDQPASYPEEVFKLLFIF